MAQRRSRATGIGRGNGAGSRATQFQPGEPSGNSRGRPRKQGRPPAPDILHLFSEALATKVLVTLNGERRTMSQLDALIHSSLAAFPRGSLSEQLRLFNFIATHLRQDSAQVDRTASPQAIADFVRGLQEIGLEQEGQGWPRRPFQ